MTGLADQLDDAVFDVFICLGHHCHPRWKLITAYCFLWNYRLGPLSEKSQRSMPSMIGV